VLRRLRAVHGGVLLAVGAERPLQNMSQRPRRKKGKSLHQ
jgi:hypothetical protein